MVHNRQFILADKPCVVDPTWKYIQLSGGRFLSYHKNLPISINIDKSICLIGDAWQVVASRLSPHKIIEKWNGNISLDEIYKQEESWCGRYVIITTEYILTDTTGNLGVFYTKSQGIISSSFALLRIFLGESEIVTPPALFMPYDADYVPGELTMDNRIKRLLPSQKLEIDTQEVSIRPLLMTKPDKGQDNLKVFENLFLQNIESMFSYYDKYDIWLPVSGGKDSRVCFAAFQKLEKNFQVYVYQNTEAIYDGGYGDLGVSRALCRRAHKKLNVVHGDPSKRDFDKEIELKRHTSGMSAMGVRWLYPCNSLCGIENSKKKVLQVRNNIWELACNDYDYHHKNKPDYFIDRWNGRAAFYEQSIENWISFVKNDIVNTDISFGDRAYWDLRLGCWLADGMQAFDIYDNIETVNILNCRLFLSLLLGLDPEVRGTRCFEVELANKWFPPFSKIPYEEDYMDLKLFCRKWTGKIQRKIKRMFHV